MDLSGFGAIADLASHIFDRVFPDKAQADQAKQQFTMELAKMQQEKDEKFQDFVINYEGAGDKVTPGLQLYRGSVRPTLTYALALAYVWGFLHPNTFQPEVMTGLFQLNLISLGFWYGQRALEQLGLKLPDMSKK